MSWPPVATLKTSLLMLVVAILLATTGVVWSKLQDNEGRAALQRAEMALKGAHTRQAQGQSEARLIEQHIDAYRALVARGFVGEENRLAWIEAVQIANQDAHLYGLTYTLSPRLPASPTLARELPLQQTRMTIKMPLLVETDLPRFLAALRARTAGVFHVSECRITRVGDPSAPPSGRPEIDAECELLWFTLAAEAKEDQ